MAMFECWHRQIQRLSAIFMLFLIKFMPFSDALRCYECSAGPNDWTCSGYTTASCGYGFFGCVKVVTFDGGVDKLGNFIDDPQAVVSMIRGCNLLPMGGVDACQQQIVLGFRVITCYCYSDYCNGSGGREGPFMGIFKFVCHIFLLSTFVAFCPLFLL